MATTAEILGFSCDNRDCALGNYTCGKCQTELHRRIWQKMKPQERAYDRNFDPLGAYTSGYSAGRDVECSCHIVSPCGYCTMEADGE